MAGAKESFRPFKKMAPAFFMINLEAQTLPPVSQTQKLTHFQTSQSESIKSQQIADRWPKGDFYEHQEKVYEEFYDTNREVIENYERAWCQNNGSPEPECLQFQQTAPHILEPENQTTSGIRWLPDKLKKYNYYFSDAAQRQSFDSDFLRILAVIENGNNEDGLMQIRPDTDKLIRKDPDCRDLEGDRIEPKTSIYLAACYVNYLMKELNIYDVNSDTVPLLALGYNGGPALARKFREGKEFEGREKMALCYQDLALALWQDRFKEESDALKNRAKFYEPCK